MTLRDYGEIRAPVGIVAGTDGKTVIASIPCACITRSRLAAAHLNTGHHSCTEKVVEADRGGAPATKARRGNVVLVIGAK
jgi:hypothetical protein